MSGIFDLWRPTNPAPDNPGLITRLVRWWRGAGSDGAMSQGWLTTEAGTSASASPSLEAFQLWQLRYERRAVIEDIRRLMKDDARLARANRKLGREAVRKGVVVSMKTAAKRGPAAGRNRRALDVMQQTLRDCELTPAKLRSWAQMLPAEGDLFIQKIVAGDRVVGAKRMPAASMERLTDSQDRFFDMARAFAQLDVATDQNIATFAAWQIHHQRWNHVDGERYGESEYIQIRRPARNLQLLEQAQVIRRIARAALRLFHSVGTRDHPGSKADIDDYKALNNTAAASKGGLDPSVALKDYYGNGNTTVTALPGDPNLDKIDDLEYFQDGFAVGTGAPKAMIGLGSKDINRDILKDQIDQWLKEVQDVTDAMVEVIRDILDFALLLAGIDPETVPYDVTFSQNTTETPAQRQERVSKARQNTRGSGKNAVPDPLIPRRMAVAALAEDYGFTDVDAVLEELATEDAQMAAIEEAAAQAKAAAAAKQPAGAEDDQDDELEQDEEDK